MPWTACASVWNRATKKTTEFDLNFDFNCYSFWNKWNKQNDLVFNTQVSEGVLFCAV